MPRAPDHRLPVTDPREAAIYYAFGLTPAELDRRLAPGADFPVLNEARRSRLAALVERCRAIAARRRDGGEGLR